MCLYIQVTQARRRAFFFLGGGGGRGVCDPTRRTKGGCTGMLHRGILKIRFSETAFHAF